MTMQKNCALTLAVSAVLAIALVAGCGGDSGGSGDASEPAAAGSDLTSQGSPQGGGVPELSIDPALLPEGVTVEMVQEGRDLFNGGGICFTCHTVEATGGPLAPDLTDDVWINVDGEYSSIVELVKTGVPQPIEHLGSMLPRAGMPLTDEQVNAVAAYAYMLSRM